MSDGDKKMAADVVRFLHGARGLPPLEAVEGLQPFIKAMHARRSPSRLASASTAAVAGLARSLKENHAASNDDWEEAIEATLSFANEAS